MMSKITKMYKSFFGLKEATAKDQALYNAELQKTVDLSKELKDTMDTMDTMTEEELAEAELTNHMNDYRGGVVYVLTDPSQADVVAQNIKRWTAKKGFTAIKHKKSADGSKGYFYFRLGPDPGTEAQKIQGYFAQLPLLKHFKFKVLGEKPVQKKPRPNI